MLSHNKKIPKTVIQAINTYVNLLHEDDLPIDKVILFGSYAKGKAHQWSDIDLCIVSPKFTNAWRATQYLWGKRINDVGLTIEPVGFSSIDYRDTSPLLSEIKRTGITIQPTR